MSEELKRNKNKNKEEAKEQANFSKQVLKNLMSSINTKKSLQKPLENEGEAPDDFGDGDITEVNDFDNKVIWRLLFHSCPATECLQRIDFLFTDGTGLSLPVTSEDDIMTFDYCKEDVEDEDGEVET